MSTASKEAERTHPTGLAPLLSNGDRMTQSEFHRRYESYPEDAKFELIGGIVYMASPLRRLHARFHVALSMVLGTYASQTPGVESLDNATTILGEESEPQPDLSLRILGDCGGQSQETDDDYISGPPELVAEIAHSSRAIDLHLKRQDYERAGVQEYIVLSVEELTLFWFDFTNNKRIVADRRGIARSLVFPGLWIHVPALVGEKNAALTTTLERGLKSPAHQTFRKELADRRRKKGRN